MLARLRSLPAIRAAAVTTLLTATMPAKAQPVDNHMRWGGVDGYGWGHVVGGGLLMVLFWVVVIVLAVLLVRALSGRSAGSGRNAGDTAASPARASALDILNERYARGEIDRDDYEARRRDILRDYPAPPR